MQRSLCVALVLSGAYRYADIPVGHDPLDILIAEEDGDELSGYASHNDIMELTGAYDGQSHRSQYR